MELKNSKKIYLGKTPDGRDRLALDIVAGDPTLEVQVGASDDDAYQREDTGGDITQTYVYVRSNSAASARYWGGCRFVSAEFPALGTTIDVAYLKVNLFSTDYDDANLNIHFEELAAPAAFTTGAGNITGRDRTEASVSWIADGIAVGGVGWFNSPSLCGVGSPIQEVFDAYSPTAIVAIIRPNTDADKYFLFYSWDQAGNVSGAILHLEWTEGVTHYGAATLSGVGTLAAIGRGIFIGKATLAGTGTLASIGRLIAVGKATLSGVGTLSALGGLLLLAKATLSGSGTLSAIGGLWRLGAATLSGTGTLSAIGRGIFAGKATLAGVGILAGIGHITAIGKATLAGAGYLSVRAAPYFVGRALHSFTGRVLSAITKRSLSDFTGRDLADTTNRDLSDDNDEFRELK